MECESTGCVDAGSVVQAARDGSGGRVRCQRGTGVWNAWSRWDVHDQRADLHIHGHLVATASLSAEHSATATTKHTSDSPAYAFLQLLLLCLPLLSLLHTPHGVCWAA